jgi:hypothetical protein
MPFMDQPATNEALLNDTGLAINTGAFPSGNVLWSPRLGFNFDLTGDLTSIVRGGIGVFSGRPPYVWMSNAFVNTGLEQVELTCSGAANVPVFVADPAAQPTTCLTGAGATATPAEINYFSDDVKYPQNLKVSLGVDKRLPGGIVGTFDFLYTKNLNQFYAQDANLRQDLGQNGEGRYMYGTVNGTGRGVAQRLTTAVTSAVFHTNSSEGRSISITGQLQKSFGAGLGFSVAYTRSSTTDVMSLTSSQAFSNYQFVSVDGSLADRNVTRSFFDVPNKLSITGSANLPFKFNLSMIYSGRSGDPYAWIVNGDVNADNISGNDLPFIPADASQITLQNPAQFAALDEFINSQECLASQRGQLHERNSCRNPWINFLDARLTKIVPTMSGQSLELSLDLFNVLNFLDRDWGLVKRVSAFEQGPRFLNSVGFDAVNNRPIYSFAAPAVIESTIFGQNTSRWRMQVGGKYRF